MANDPNLTTKDYLGRDVPVSFQGQPALPTGGPTVGAAAPANVGVGPGGEVSGGVGDAAGLGGPGGGGQPGEGGPSALSLFAKSLGLAGDVADVVGKEGAAGSPTDAPLVFPGGPTKPSEYPFVFEDPNFPGVKFPTQGLEGVEMLPNPSAPAFGASGGPIAGPEGIEGAVSVPGVGAEGAAGLGASAGDYTNIAAALLGIVAQITGDPDIAMAAKAASAAGSGIALGSTIAGTAGLAGTGAGVAGGASASGAGLAGAGTGLAAGAGAGAGTGAAAGGAAAGAGGAGAAAGGGVGAATGIAGAMAVPVLLWTGAMMAAEEEDKAQAFRQLHSIRTLLKDKVPAAVNGLHEALQGAASLPANATTDQLMATMQSLQQARLNFNEVDHAFKSDDPASPGVVFMGNRVNTGLDFNKVRPMVNALDEAQLKLQDELFRRGVTPDMIPGYRDAASWLQFMDPAKYQQATNAYRDKIGGSLTPIGPARQAGQTEAEFEAADLAASQRNLARHKMDSDKVMDPDIKRLLDLIGPGEIEAGLAQMLGRPAPERAAPMTDAPLPTDPGMPLADFAGAALGGKPIVGGKPIIE